MTKKIKSWEQLKDLAGSDNGCDCFIKISGGLKSSKHITYDGQDEFFVLNLIDESKQVLTEKQMKDKDVTNIGFALNVGALYLD